MARPALAGGGVSLAQALIALEASAARVEGVFVADPEIAALWRGPAMLTEACRSVGLEDIHVLEGDVLRRAWENRETELEIARGTQAVLSMLPVIASPPDLRGDAEAGLARLLRAAVPPDLPQEDADATRDADDLARAAGAVTGSLKETRSPILGALHAAMALRFEAEARYPSAERLVFMAAEHGLRSLEARDGAGRGTPLFPTPQGRWICLPSVGLTQGRFHAWSPGTRDGAARLIAGLQAEIDRTLGAIPVLRRWRDAARAHADGRHGRSRIGALVQLAIAEPVLTTARVHDALGVSLRSAHDLVDEAAAVGILTRLTPRQTYRAWGTPMMAERLQMRAARAGQAARGAPAAEARPVKPAEAPEAEVDALAADVLAAEREERKAREAELLSDLDAAIAQADAVLARYQGR